MTKTACSVPSMSDEGSSSRNQTNRPQPYFHDAIQGLRQMREEERKGEERRGKGKGDMCVEDKPDTRGEGCDVTVRAKPQSIAGKLTAESGTRAREPVPAHGTFGGSQSTTGSSGGDHTKAVNQTFFGDVKPGTTKRLSEDEVVTRNTRQ